MRKLIFTIMLVAFLSTYLSSQSVNFKLGLFYPTLDSDLWDINKENLAFSNQDMIDGYFGIEFEKFFSKAFSVSIEAGHYEKEHYSQYSDYEYEDGEPIFQNIALDISSLEIDFTFYPMGHRKQFNPYFGAGVGIYHWTYTQWGDFINFEDLSVSEDELAESSTYTPGFSAKAGFVYRFRRSLGVSVEAVYQYLKGPLSSYFQGFEALDMSGLRFNLGIHWFLR